MKGATVMTNKEIGLFEIEINGLEKRIDRRTDRIDKAIEAGDKEKETICRRAQLKDESRLDGISFALSMLGYRIGYDSDRDKYTVEKSPFIVE